LIELLVVIAIIAILLAIYSRAMSVWMVAARHLNGNSKAAPRNVAPKAKLAGGIAVSFADAHVEVVRLDNLWQLYWHRGYQPPLRKPD
jgi:prepilin-type N-terminal cleavage/methylation domain-containing protein